MSIFQPDRPVTASPFRTSLILFMGVLLAASILGLLAALNYLLPVMLLTGLCLAVTVILVPEMLTLAVLFLIYTNALTVAVQFHGLPLVAGALFQGLLAVQVGYDVVFRKKRIQFNAVLVVMFLWLAVQALGGIFAIRPSTVYDKMVSFFLEGIVLYFLVINTVRSPGMLRMAVWTVAAAGMVMGGISFYQELTGTYDNDYWGFAQLGADFSIGEETAMGEPMKPRLAGPIGENNRYGQIMVMTTPLALMLALSERSKKLRLLALAATGLVLVGALLTYSRGGFLALAFTGLLMIAFGFIRIRHLSYVLIFAMILPLAVPHFAGRLMKLQSLSLEGVINRGPEGGIEEADSSVQGRVTEMISAFQMFADYPLLGVGTGQYHFLYQKYAPRVGLEVKTTNRAPHTLYGGVAAENGILGLACLFGVFTITLGDLFRARRWWQQVDSLQSAIAAGLILAVVAYLTSGIFLHFAYIRYVWLLMGLAGAAAIIHRAQAQEAGEGEVRA